MERKSVAILRYRTNLFGRKEWHLDYKLTWTEYLEYSKNVKGEGENWKAQII
jgi:hypothetical protein